MTGMDPVQDPTRTQDPPRRTADLLDPPPKTAEEFLERIRQSGMTAADILGQGSGVTPGQLFGKAEDYAKGFVGELAVAGAGTAIIGAQGAKETATAGLVATKRSSEVMADQVMGIANHLIRLTGGEPSDATAAERFTRITLGVAIDHHPEAVAILEAHYEPGMLNPARMRMTRIPDGATLVDNPVSKAPGFRIENVYVFAGVPSIMAAMFEGIRHQLVGGAPVLSRTVASFLPEGTVAEPVGALQQRFPAIEIGSYPFYRMAKFGTSIVFRGTDAATLDAAAEAFRQIVRDLGEQPFDEKET